ncbi:VasL domain-containing protein [Pantoea sp. 1.19]|uniref:VasL domain-containing protein n=1 Tax=Pantoea sp. 1.19 TaxID=1925589 RepID=UPI000948F999|nr:VasL domain-containing protein [Pantoea sp. 1.19]
MHDISPRKIKTGGDPRTLPDYAALRDEMHKLTHPARPDVNWRYVEQRCLSLFEQNGVELQTAAWYTLARTQLAGLVGLNEGLAIVTALISHQWGALWPQPVHARLAILSSLSQRLQQRMRTLPLSYGDLGQLYRAERSLNELGEVLQRLELKHLSQLDTLRTLMHNSAVRLENSDRSSHAAADIPAESALPAGVIPEAAAGRGEAAPLPEETAHRAVQWVYVTPPERRVSEAEAAAMPAAVKKWPAFAAGMGTMLVISSVAVGSWQFLQRPDPLQAQLAASLDPLPATLTPEQRAALAPPLSLARDVISQTQRQLIRLDALPPDWRFAYGGQLVEQAQALWPEQAKPLATLWRQQLTAAAMPVDNLAGWHQGMVKLRQLSDRLNALDEQKGKYMTVSELKSVVFSTLQSFNQSIPAEEQLRRLSDQPAGAPLPAAAGAQLEMHLKQLAARYAVIKEGSAK